MTRPPTPAASPLQARIRTLGYEQSEVAAHLGVSKQEMSSWCTGRVTPRGPRRRELAEFLDCSVALIFPDGTQPAGHYPETGAEVVA